VQMVWVEPHDPLEQRLGSGPGVRP
jgi:hypothetical protein